MKKLLAIILSITMLLSMGTVVFADDVNEPMQKAKIKVGISADFPPFEYYNENGELYGFDVDLMNYIGERIGFDIEFVNMSFDQLFSAVIDGEVACTISGIAITEERKNVIDYTIPYLSAKVTYSDGETSDTSIEQYAIVFPNNSVEKAKVLEAAGQIAIYNLVNDALTELIEDKTVEKLGEKYNLNKAADTDEFDYEYTVMPVPTDLPNGKNDTTGDKVMSDGTPPAPPSDWAKESVDKAKSLNIINDDVVYSYRMSITREKFCEIIYNYCSIVGELVVDDGHIVFKDTDNVKVQILNAMGIINGKSSTEFAPNDLLTREEAATILFRMIDAVHPDWAAHQVYYDFEDAADISDWAMDSIQTICNMGVIEGVGNKKFAPKDTFTTEQAIATIVRVYDGFNPKQNDSKWDNLTFADKLNANMPVDKNYMFSPLSIKMALMMAANGASGETVEEILKVTGVDDLESYNSSTRAMLDKYSESDILTLNVSNSIWINSDKTPQRFSKTYQDMLSKTFDATSDIVTDKNAVSEINGWVNDKTEGKIPTIITEDNKDFWAMLVNAVYFKGRWLNEFNKGATEKDVFTSRDSSQTEIEFMNRRAWMSYANTDGVSIVALPYLTRQDVFNENGEYIETKKLDGVNISMYLMMSDGSFSPEEVLNKAEMDSTYITLSVPKFNIEYSTGLNDILKTIGINKAFEENAEFEKMFDSGNMWIDSSIHKTYIKVDEEGTEAAAVTSVGMAGSSMPPEPIEVKFNKPFTFVIKDNANGEFLFMGEYAFAE